MPRPGPILFQCDRLHSRLTTISCALRWAGANSKDGSNELTQSACRGCPIGEGHAKEPSRAAVLPTQPMEIITMPTQKTCQKCEKPYTARGNSQRYCDACGPQKKTITAKPDRVPRAARMSAAAAPAPTKTDRANGTRRLAELRQLREHLANALAGVDTVLDFLTGGAS